MNKSVEGLQANVERLQAYKSKLVVFKNDKEAVGATQFCGEFMPVEKVAPKVEFMEVTPEMKKREDALRDVNVYLNMYEEARDLCAVLNDTINVVESTLKDIQTKASCVC